MDLTPLQSKLKETEDIIFDLEKNLKILLKKKKCITKITAKSRVSAALAESLIITESRAQKEKLIGVQEEMIVDTLPQESGETTNHLDKKLRSFLPLCLEAARLSPVRTSQE
jgi:hypothetical protein